jgi:hypothetical protein
MADIAGPTFLTHRRFAPAPSLPEFGTIWSNHSVRKSYWILLQT